MSEGLELFEKLVAASRLSHVVAPFTLRRLLLTHGVFPQDMTREDLRRVLPALRQALVASLDAQTLSVALREVNALAKEDVPPPDSPSSSA